LLIVLAFAGDSTMTIFMYFQLLTGNFGGDFARFAASLSGRTWVLGPLLSNGQMVREQFLGRI
jgi:hypothetical protein